MNKKHVPVTDMTAGQIYDAIQNGEIFYCNGKVIVYKDAVTALLIRAKDKEVELSMTGIRGELQKGTITRQVETPWTDHLDGTWENGVWCMCWDDGVKASFEKIYRVDSNCYEAKYSYYDNATPLPQDLADQLEELSQKSLT